MADNVSANPAFGQSFKNEIENRVREGMDSFDYSSLIMQYLEEEKSQKLWENIYKEEEWQQRKRKK